MARREKEEQGRDREGRRGEGGRCKMKVSNEDGKEGSKEGEKDKRAGPVCYYPPV